MEPTQLAIIYHRFPHLNTTLHRVNSTFNSSSDEYLTSLGVLGAVPPLLLIFALLLLLLYLVTRCCDEPRDRKKASLGFVKVMLAIGGILCCSTLALGLYGNDDAHNSIGTIVKSVTSVDKYLQNVQAETRVAELIINGEIQGHVRELANEFDKQILNTTVSTEMQVNLHFLRANLSLALARTAELSTLFDERIDPKRVLGTIEGIRFHATLGVLILFIIFNVILFYGIARHSRGAFIMFSVLGLFAVILNWVLVSFYLVGGVATGDMCITPLSVINTELKLHTAIQQSIVDYFVQCNSANPLIEHVTEIGFLVEACRASTRLLKRDGTLYYDPNVLTSHFSALFDSYSTLDNVTNKILSSSSCSLPHLEFVNAITSWCGNGLYGISLLLLSSLGAAIMFSLLVGFDSHTWIYIRKRKPLLQHSSAGPGCPSGPESISFLQPQSHHHSNRRGGGNNNSSHGRQRSPKGPWVTPSLDQTMASTRL